MSGSATAASDWIFPPMLAGAIAGDIHVVHTMATGVAAARATLSTGLTVAKCFITVWATTYDCYVAFKKGTAAATVAKATGYLVPAGGERYFIIDPAVVDDVEVIAPGGTGTLQWYVSSPRYEKGAAGT